MLEAMGFPDEAIEAILWLVGGLRHILRWNGKLYPGPDALDGLSQGGGLSPTLLLVLQWLCWILLLIEREKEPDHPDLEEDWWADGFVLRIRLSQQVGGLSAVRKEDTLEEQILGHLRDHYGTDGNAGPASVECLVEGLMEMLEDELVDLTQANKMQKQLQTLILRMVSTGKLRGGTSWTCDEGEEPVPQTILVPEGTDLHHERPTAASLSRAMGMPDEDREEEGEPDEENDGAGGNIEEEDDRWNGWGEEAEKEISAFFRCTRRAFDRYHEATGGVLSLKKSKLLPTEALGARRPRLRELMQELGWEDLGDVEEFIYLGILMGPYVRPTEVFQRAKGRTDDRLALWLNRAWGKHAGALIWKIYFLSVYAFPAKFFRLPAGIKAHMDQQMRRLSHSSNAWGGPGLWFADWVAGVKDHYVHGGWWCESAPLRTYSTQQHRVQGLPKG